MPPAACLPRIFSSMFLPRFTNSDSDFHGGAINTMSDLYLSHLAENHLRSCTIKGTM